MLRCPRQHGFDPGCRFQLTHAKPARSRAVLGFLGYVAGATIFGRLDQFGIGTNTSGHQQLLQDRLFQLVLLNLVGGCYGQRLHKADVGGLHVPGHHLGRVLAQF